MNISWGRKEQLKKTKTTRNSEHIFSSNICSVTLAHSSSYNLNYIIFILYENVLLTFAHTSTIVVHSLCKDWNIMAQASHNDIILKVSHSLISNLCHSTENGTQSNYRFLSKHYPFWMNFKQTKHFLTLGRLECTNFTCHSSITCSIL